MAALAGKFGGKIAGDMFTMGDRGRLKDALNATPYHGFSAGGLTSSVGAGGRIEIESSGERQGYVQSIADIFSDYGSDIRDDLLPQVAPGFGRLTAASANALNMRRDKSISTLSGNLAKRRVGGSNFAMNALGNVDAEYAKIDDEMRSKNFLMELKETERLKGKAYEQDMNSFMTFMNEMNLHADIARGVATSLIQPLAALQGMKAQYYDNKINAEQEFWGSMGGDFGSMLGGTGGGGTNYGSGSVTSMPSIFNS